MVVMKKMCNTERLFTPWTSNYGSCATNITFYFFFTFETKL